MWISLARRSYSDCSYERRRLIVRRMVLHCPVVASAQNAVSTSYLKESYIDRPQRIHLQCSNRYNRKFKESVAKNVQHALPHVDDSVVLLEDVRLSHAT